MIYNRINILDQVLKGAGAKILSAVMGFVLVSVSIRYLNAEEYGLWISLYTFVNWFLMLDFGIGSGLRNKLTAALSNNRTKEAREYTSTSYFFMLIIILFLLLIYLNVDDLIDWNSIFNLDDSNQVFSIIVNFTLLSFLLTLLLKMSVNVAFSLHKSHFSSIVFLAQQTFSVFVILFLIFFDESNSTNQLYKYAITINLINVLVLLVFNFYMFFVVSPELRPSIIFFNIKKVGAVVNLGMKIFIIQICAVCLYSTDIFLINKFSSSIDAAQYAILQKYFGVSVFLSGILIAPIWSVVTAKKESNDMKYLSKLYNKMLIILFFLIIFTLFLSLIFEYVAVYWIGESILFDYKTIFLMSIYTSVLIYLQLQSSFLNGFGSVSMQLIFALIASVVNIVFTIYVLAYLNLGINYALLISILVNIPSVIIFTCQVKKIIANNAHGIWIK